MRSAGTAAPEVGFVVNVGGVRSALTPVIAGTEWSADLPTSLTEGTYEITAIATDAAGNISSAGFFTVTVDNTGPTVTRVEAVSPTPRSSVVSTLNVTFSEPIDLTTFDWNDLSLTLNGGSNLITNAVTIGLASSDIAPGEHVHSHNVEDITNRLCNEYERAFRARKG